VRFYCQLCSLTTGGEQGTIRTIVNIQGTKTIITESLCDQFGSSLPAVRSSRVGAFRERRTNSEAVVDTTKEIIKGFISGCRRPQAHNNKNNDVGNVAAHKASLNSFAHWRLVNA